MLWTPEHESIKETVRQFARTEINPFCDEWEKAKQFPIHELFKKAGVLGLLGVKYDEKYGGLGLDFSYSVAVAEALGEANCGGVPLALGVQTDMCTPALARFGSEELKQQYLVPSIAGDAVGCVAISEPQAGSDVAGLTTTARRDGDDYVISGTKMWITNGLTADWCCLLANTSTENAPHGNKSLFIVPMHLKGIEKHKIYKLGMHSSDTAQLFFDDVRIPARNLIGQEGAGFMYQMMQFQEERLWGAANCLYFFDRLIDETIIYTRQRQAFRKSILDFQVVHYRLAELRTEVELLRSLTYRATEQYVRGENVTRLASMAKLKCGRLARELSDACLQYWGGMGFAEETMVSRAYRDLRLVSIGGGADEVMLGILCKLEDTLPKRRKK